MQLQRKDAADLPCMGVSLSALLRDKAPQATNQSMSMFQWPTSNFSRMKATTVTLDVLTFHQVDLMRLIQIEAKTLQLGFLSES